MTPKEILQKWIDCFNAADAVALANLYAQDAINHQVANTPVIGKTAIHEMFVNEFATSKMVCIVEHIFEDGEWAIMEWKDPLGLRGCGFFHVQNDKIVFQRGYWDKLSFLKQHGLPVENRDENPTPHTVRYGNHHSFFRVRFFQRFVCGILICIQRL